MKNFILLSIILSMIFFVSCGDDNGNEPTDTPSISLISHDTLLTAYTDNYMELITSPVIKNDSDEEIEVIINIEVVSMAQGHSYNFCVGENCITEETDYTGNYQFGSLLKIPANTTIQEGYITLSLNYTDESETPIQGTTELKVEFIESGKDESDASYNLKFEIKPPVFELVEPIVMLSGSLFSDDELITYCQVKNNTDEEIAVKVKMEMISMVEGHMAAVCTDICYAYVSTDFDNANPLIIPANSTSAKQAFSGHYNYSLNGMPSPGTSKIKYVFYLEDEPEISKEYVCTFNVQ
jgi:GTP cyclohydrolase I